MRKKAIAIIILLSLSVLILAWWYAWNKPHRNVSEEAGIVINADSLFFLYSANEKEANQQFLDKALVVNGVVQEVISNQQGQQVIVLSTGDPLAGIAATFIKKLPEKIDKGSTVKLKGICSGYSSDVVLRDCILLND